MPPPPVPSLPIGPAPVSILRTTSSFADGGGPAVSRTSLSMPGSPPRPPRPLPGVGVCSTLPPPRPSFSQPQRAYGHSPASSYSSMISSASGGRRPLLNISAPIPGLGDVPPLPTTSAVFSRERGGVSPTTSHDNMAANRRTLPALPTASIDNTLGHARTDSVTTNDSSDQPPHSRRRIHSHLQDRLSNGYGGEMSPSPSMPSTLAKPPTPAVASAPAPERQSTGEQDFIFDARVAAMLSDPPLPPTTTPFTRIKATDPGTDVFTTVPASPLSNVPPPGRQQSRLRMYANTHSPVPSRPSSVVDNSEMRILPPGALLSRGESLGVSNRAAYPRAPKFVADGPRPDSLLSTASWASAASGPRLHAHDGVRVHRAGSMSDSIMGSVSESISGSISGGDSSMDDSVEDLRTVEDCGPMLPIRVGADPRNSLIVIHPQDPITPKSHQFPPSALLAPPSSFADGTPGSIYSNTSASSSNTDLHDSANSRTPTASRIKLMRSPSATREIDTLRTRNSLLEVTNARLEADLKKARSDVSLRPGNASIYSSARPGTKRDSASTTKTATANKRDSALTIRDDGAGIYSQMNAGGGRSQADLAVPALLSEIELLKRSGAQLQAELQAVRSQVSLLFPPTPAEMAEQEARDPSGGLSSPGRMSTDAKPDRNPFRASKHGGVQSGLVTPTLSSTSAVGMGSPSSSSSRSHSAASTASTPLTPQMSTQWAQVQTGPGSTVKLASYDKYTTIPPAHFTSIPPTLAPVPATRATVPVHHPQPRPMSAFSARSINTLSSRTPPPRPPRRVSRMPAVPAANINISTSVRAA